MCASNSPSRHLSILLSSFPSVADLGYDTFVPFDVPCTLNTLFRGHFVSPTKIYQHSFLQRSASGLLVVSYVYRRLEPSPLRFQGRSAYPVSRAHGADLNLNSYLFEDGFNIHHRCAVDCLHVAQAQALALHCQHCYQVNANRIGAVG